jgi:hypothetical protein
MKILFLLLFLFPCFASFAQNENEPTVFRITSAYTSFPDTVRATGHTYNKVSYTAAVHYSDSSVLIAVPPHFKAGKHVDVIFWFHGWRNNIDTAAAYFELTKQFLASNRNAVLVLPETAKNAPDSYGGKLEQNAVFKTLLKDVLHKLKTEKIIGKRTKTGNIVLAGHSGAFRVMAYILQNGGVEVKQVILFDGLYSQIDKYTAWIQADASHQFINLYTNKGGGTDEVSEKMMQLLREKTIPFINAEEKDVHTPMLKTNQVIFIHSFKEHNDVINRPDHNFRLFLENSNTLDSLNIPN